MAGRWGRGVGVAVLAAVLGTACGQGGEEAPARGVELPRTSVIGDTPPAPPANPQPAPPPPQPSYRYPLPEGPWVPPDASTLAFEVPACVAREVPEAPRDVKPCEVRTVRPDGRLSLRERFDAEGRVRETFFHGPDGRVNHTVEHTWENGHEVRRVSTPENGPSTVQEWKYDEEGRLVSNSTRVGGRSPQTETRTFYDAQGRIERTEQNSSGYVLVRRYTYSPRGPLESVSWEARDVGPEVVERYTYHPNGQLHRFVSRPPTMGGEQDREYDEAGRLVFQQACSHKGCWGDTRAYTAEGRLVRVHSRRTMDTVTTEGDRLFVYDSEGRVRVDAFLQNVDAMDGRYQERQVHRSIYACGSGALLTEEWDQDADGTPDGWIELERDAEGKLVVERFTGSAATPEKARREYDYQCQ